ncbi:MAG: ABC transporter substrate-binding protein [bacterium]
MKKLIVLLIALSFVFIACNEKSKPEGKEVIKIGAILPLTGSAAPYGNNAKNGIELAITDIEKIYSIKIEVIYEDSKTDPQSAVNALKKLYSINKIKIIIGDINSSGLLAMAPIAEKNKIILLSPGASNPKISYAGKYIFRNWHSDALEGEIAAKFAFDSLKWKKTAILFVNASYGIGLAETFKNIFSNLGGDVISYESYQQNAYDMREQIITIKKLNPDGLYLPGWPKEMSIALRQLKQLGVKLQILSSQGFDDPLILSLAGKSAEGVIYTVPKEADTSNSITINFKNKYKSIYGKEPGVCSASGYDALKILVTAIKNVGTNIDRIQYYLSNLKDFPGVDGNVTFDENGDLIKPFLFKIVKNNNIIKY